MLESFSKSNLVELESHASIRPIRTALSSATRLVVVPIAWFKVLKVSSKAIPETPPLLSLPSWGKALPSLFSFTLFEEGGNNWIRLTSFMLRF